MVARYSMMRYLAGATCARTGDEVSGPALLLLALAVSGSSAQASFLYGGLTIAAGVGGPAFGVVLDRADHPGRVLAAALFAYGIGLAFIAIMLGRVSLIVVVGGAVVVGLLAPALAGGWTSQLPFVIPTSRQRSANAMDAATYNLSSLAGPALAAVVAATFGAVWAVTSAVVLLLVAAPMAWLLPRRQHPADSSSIGNEATVSRDLRAGFRAIIVVPGLRAITAGSCTAYFGFGIFVVACPILGQMRLGGPGRGALLLSVVAASALLATTAMARWPPPWEPDKTFVAATSLAAVALLAIGIGANPVGLVICATLLGVADGPQLVAIFAIRQRDAPPQWRGQIFTTAASLKLTAGATGAAAGGLLLAHSAVGALSVAAASQVAALLVSESWPRQHTRRPRDRSKQS